MDGLPVEAQAGPNPEIQEEKEVDRLALLLELQELEAKRFALTNKKRALAKTIAELQERKARKKRAKK